MGSIEKNREKSKENVERKVLGKGGGDLDLVDVFSAGVPVRSNHSQSVSQSVMLG